MSNSDNMVDRLNKFAQVEKRRLQACLRRTRRSRALIRYLDLEFEKLNTTSSTGKNTGEVRMH